MAELTALAALIERAADEARVVKGRVCRDPSVYGTRRYRHFTDRLEEALDELREAQILVDKHRPDLLTAGGHYLSAIHIIHSVCWNQLVALTEM